MRYIKSSALVSLINTLYLTAYSVPAFSVTYEYDQLNRLINVVSEDGSSVNYTYDASGNRIERVITAITVESDLLISKSDSVDPVESGSELIYSVNVSNQGPDTASNVEVSDSLPGDVSFDSVGGDGWICEFDAGLVTCSRPELGVGNAPLITITTTAPAFETMLTNVVSVNADSLDPDPSNNSFTETTTVMASTVAESDLSIEKADSPDPVRPKKALIYTLEIANAGPDAAENIVVEDALPQGVTFQNAVGEGWSCSYGSGLVTCTRASLGVGETSGITIEVAAPKLPPQQTIILTNTATVSSTTEDPDLTNNSATEDTIVKKPGGGKPR